MVFWDLHFFVQYGFIHVEEGLCGSLVFMPHFHSIFWAYCGLFTHSSFRGYWDCFQCFAVLISSTMIVFFLCMCLLIKFSLGFNLTEIGGVPNRLAGYTHIQPWKKTLNGFLVPTSNVCGTMLISNTWYSELCQSYGCKLAFHGDKVFLASSSSLVRWTPLYKFIDHMCFFF